MHLAIDVGNSETVAGLGQGTDWLARWRLATDARRTADELCIALGNLFRMDGHSPAHVDGVVISSVVPVVTQVMVDGCRRLFAPPPLLVGPGVRTGMAVRYDPPNALGSDRLADALAARQLYGAPVIAVDFGTATTFNVVDPDGNFAGGAIAPGIGVAAEALAESGARLRPVDLAAGKDFPLIGRTTDQSMRSGVLFGYAALVDGLLDHLCATLAARHGIVADHVPVVATGGMAAVMASLIRSGATVNPDLTLEGLRLILNFAQSEPRAT